jgi:hypothetical protein
VNVLFNIIEIVYVCLRDLEISFEKGEMRTMVIEVKWFQ